MDGGPYYYQPPIQSYPLIGDELYYQEQFFHRNMQPCDEDSMYYHQMEDTEHMINIQDFMNQKDENEKVEEMQQISNFNETDPPLEATESSHQDDIEEIRQMELFDQMQQRIQMKLESGSLRGGGQQKHFAEELEPIHNPEFDKRALPIHSTFVRSVNRRGSIRRKRNPRSKSLGRIPKRDDSRDERNHLRYSRNKKQSKSSRSRASRNNRSSVEEREAPESSMSRSRSYSHPELTQNDSHSSSGSVESNVSNVSWNQAVSPLELLNGVIESISNTFQNIGINADESGDDSNDSEDGSETSYDSDDS